jgi:4-amino-4-deoxychorismate lyase
MTVVAMAVAGRGLVDPAEPVLHADDKGLQRGQAAFETVRVYGGRPFALDEHLDRLSASAERIGLPPVARETLDELARTVVAAGGLEECVLRFYWTGGREEADEATALAIVSPLPVGYEEQRARGMHLIALQLGIPAALRSESPWLLGGVKSTSYAINMAAEAEAQRRGADDAVFLSGDGYVLEGPVTNIWWREGVTLFTPTLELGILAGVTRSQIIRSAGDLGYEVDEGRFVLEALAEAEEAFTSSSVREIMPVVRLDDRPLGGGRPGPAAEALQESLRRAAGAAGAAGAAHPSR